jgi:HdeA/HdeB family
MKKSVGLAFAAAALSMLLPGPMISAQESTTRDIAKVDCKTVMRLDDRERESAIVFLHGYLVGKKGDTLIDLAKLGVATDKFIDNCLDNPKSMALEVMTAAVQ